MAALHVDAPVTGPVTHHLVGHHSAPVPSPAAWSWCRRVGRRRGEHV